MFQFKMIFKIPAKKKKKKKKKQEINSYIPFS